MKIIAIVVTYNRLSLLKECIIAIETQTRRVDELIVINNTSTDGTEEWLNEEKVNHITIENKGGASGFNAGIKLAYERGAKWIWMMDDDAIPHADALEKLEGGVHYFNACKINVGFFASNVLWTDGRPHLMNKTYEYDLKKEIPSCFNMPTSGIYKLITGATFVSLLLSAKAVEKIGLPIKEFFIWCDDVEYTKRIVFADLWGVFVENSKVIHKTPANYGSNIFEDSPKNIWKYNYGMRNELYTRRVYKSTGSFYRNVFKRIFVWPFKIISKRKDNRWLFVRMIWSSSIAALNFRPKIERVEDNKQA
ncbi:MAG: hypothetical protein JWQ96_2957 [Segetibacter sp.]|nr:hypothetical protein [Segetibacter sp.]